MEVCIHYGGQLHCHFIPIYDFPIILKRPGIGPINYPAFLADATIVASLGAAAAKVTDEHVKAALLTGVESAVKAMQAHAGEGVQIRMVQTQN